MGLAARLAHEARKRPGVAVANLAALKVGGSRRHGHELAADRENANDRATVDIDLTGAGGGQHAQSIGVHERPRRKRDLASLELFAGKAHEVARLHGSGERHARAGLALPAHNIDELEFLHGVGTLGYGGARHEAHRLAGLENIVKSRSRADVAHDVHFDTGRLACAFKVTRPDGVAVHRGIVERCDVDVAHDIVRKNAA